MADSKIRKLFRNILSDDRKSLAALGLAALLTFGNMFQNGFIVDDFSFIVDWPLIQNLWNIPRFFVGYIPPEGQAGVYSPLRTLIFALNFACWKFSPAGYHLFSLAVHLTGIYFVYRLTLLLVRNRFLGFMTALFFAVHPVHVESVTAITGSVDSVGVVFLFAAFYYYVRATYYEGKMVPDPHGKETPIPVSGKAELLGVDRKYYLLSLCLALLGIFTHELVLMLPFLFAFYDGFFRGQPVPRRQIILRNLPFWGMAVVYIIFKGLVLGGISRGHYLFNNFFLSFLVEIKVLARYVWVSFFPFSLSHNPVISPGIFSFNEQDFDPQAVMSQSIWDAPVVLSLLFLTAVAVMAFKSYKKQPLVSFCIGWFFLCLLPVCQIVPSSVFYAERYLYPGSWAACLLLSVMIERIYGLGESSHKTRRQTESPGLWKQVSVITALFFVIFYSVRTSWRNTDLRNEITAYESALRSNPYSAAMRNDMGIVYSKNEDYDKAVESIQKAISLKPRESHYHFTLAETYFLAQQPDKAVASLEQAVAITPDFAEAYYNLASIYGYRGQRTKAEEYLKKAGEAFKNQGRILEAGEYASMLEQSLNSSRKQNPNAAYPK